MARVYFSKKEIIHLLISVLVMGFLVAANMVSRSGLDFLNLILGAAAGFPLALLIIVPAFVCHELGHKIVAQKFGFWAEYRMWTQGLLLAILFFVITKGTFLFIAPGAVYFAANHFHRANTEKIGKVGLIGPVINILLGVVFGLSALFIGGGGIWAGVFAVGARVNAFLAIFNLLPFPPFDGQKVFAWDKKMWLAAILLAVVLFITASFSL